MGAKLFFANTRQELSRPWGAPTLGHSAQKKARTCRALILRTIAPAMPGPSSSCGERPSAGAAAR